MRDGLDEAQRFPVSQVGAPATVVAAVAASIADLPRRYLFDRAPAEPRRYRLSVIGCPAFTVFVDRRACRVRQGTHWRPDAELMTDPASWLDLASGDRTGLDLFFHGLLRVRGDLNEALRLETLFAPPQGSPGALAHARIVRHEVRAGRFGRVEVEAFEAGKPDGERVLFLHGLGASKVSLLPAIAGLAETHRVTAIDLPGHGKSSAPVGAAYDAAWMARIADRVLDESEIGETAVVGNSMGGRVGVELALHRPDRITALGLLCPAVAFDEYRMVRPVLSALRLDVALSAPPWPTVGRLPRQLIDAGLRSLFADHQRVPAANLLAARDDFLRSMSKQRRRLALLACTRHLGLENPKHFWRRLADLGVPSLWIFGDRDRLVSSAYAEGVQRVLPHATVEVWRSCGHVPQFEHPLRTVERLDAFLRSVGATGAGENAATTGTRPAPVDGA